MLEKVKSTSKFGESVLLGLPSL